MAPCHILKIKSYLHHLITTARHAAKASSVPTTAVELSTTSVEGQTPLSEDKLKMKEVIAACRVAISHQQSNEDPEVTKAFRVLQRFADLKEKESESAIGYSRVTRAMLNDLSIKTRFLRLDKGMAIEHAAGRKLTERFTQDKKYYSTGGLGKKEALASLLVANYILEALYAPRSPLFIVLLIIVGTPPSCVKKVHVQGSNLLHA